MNLLPAYRKAKTPLKKKRMNTDVLSRGGRMPDRRNSGPKIAAISARSSAADLSVRKALRYTAFGFPEGAINNASARSKQATANPFQTRPVATLTRTAMTALPTVAIVTTRNGSAKGFIRESRSFSWNIVLPFTGEGPSTDWPIKRYPTYRLRWSSADSGRSGALIPIEVGQSFRSKWGAVPAGSGALFG